MFSVTAALFALYVGCKPFEGSVLEIISVFFTHALQASKQSSRDVKDSADIEYPGSTIT